MINHFCAQWRNSSGKTAKRLDQPLSLFLVFCLLFFADTCYRHIFFNHSLSITLLVACIDALLYTAILFVAIRVDLVKSSVCFLALPYVFFIPGWLNVPTAILLSVLLVYSTVTLLRQGASTGNPHIRWGDFFAFAAILVLINVSGAGGYGYQWNDYGINNARLHDLVVHAWPIRYGENQNFVYYFGYFLPAAIVGKLSNVDLALKSMYPWTLLGVTLAIRWLSVLSRWKFSVWLVAVFALFGAWDIINALILAQMSDMPIARMLANILEQTDNLHFATSTPLGFFLGNYLSNTFGLYWSPQQVIGGWLCAGLLTHFFLRKQFRHFVFVYALLCLWGPLAMIALLPLVFVGCLACLLSAYWRHILSVENIVAASALAVVFVVFYTSGSAAANPSRWLFTATDWHGKTGILLLFFLLTWGVYVIATLPWLCQADSDHRLWYGFLIIALLLLPIRLFGEWSDLLCRGSAPLMFLLLFFVLRAIHDYWSQQKFAAAILLFCVLIPGIGSAVTINYLSLKMYGQGAGVAPLVSYHNAYPNFGPDHSLFEKLFRRSLPASAP